MREGMGEILPGCTAAYSPVVALYVSTQQERVSSVQVRSSKGIVEVVYPGQEQRAKKYYLPCVPAGQECRRANVMSNAALSLCVSPSLSPSGVH